MAFQSEVRPTAAAILAPERPPLCYSELREQVESVGRRLSRLGIGPGDRVAIVIANGPELAVAFVSVASFATSAPLNPSYREEEFEFYLSDLRARLLIVGADQPSASRGVAARLGIPVIELTPRESQSAGLFDLSGVNVDATAAPIPAAPDDVALVLHTSGTTSRPKMVPLTQRNLCASARNIGRTLELSPRERCLNVMPLFHIHGLMAATLSSLAAGGSLVCTPGFYAPRFFEWIDAFQPTWYTAVPTMHQAILSRAAENADIIRRRRLRFIRSSSASLPPRVLSDLERTFGAPVIESYGMTEAAHQMTSNPLPPGIRKPGTVGSAAGPAVAITDPSGVLLPAGEEGEIVIRGVNVTRGYKRNPEANRTAFTDGWFHTGDLGHFDADGYLTITGRIKEIINRGGEKISPREVDERILDHPAVAQVVTFAMPHVRLGEAVAAAVVLREGAELIERQVQDFVVARLPDFKVPARVVFVDEIPKGATGKLQRIGLAERLGLVSDPEIPESGARQRVAPRTPLEEQLLLLWREVLGRRVLFVHDHFLSVGGDSMLAAQLLSRIGAAHGADISILDLFGEDGTISPV